MTDFIDTGMGLKELAGTHNGQPRTFFHYVDKFSGRPIVFMSKPSHGTRVATLIGEGGSIWTAIDVLLGAEFLWPIWVRQHEESNPNAEAHEYERAFQWAAKTPAQSVQLFFARGWERHQIFAPNPDHIDQPATERLRTVGLVVAAAKAPIEVLVQYLPANDLKAPIKARGIKPGLKDAVQNYYAQHMNDDFERQLRASPWLVGRQCFLPPKGFTWTAWHAFRNVYVDMFFALIDWAAGGSDPDRYAALD